MLAVDTMDPTLQGIFFLVALVLFTLAALVPISRPNFPALWLVPAGLAFFTVPFMWNAFAAS